MMTRYFNAQELELDPMIATIPEDEEPTYLELMQEEGEEHVRIAHSNAKRHRDGRRNHAR